MAAGVCGVAIVAIIVLAVALSENVVYYRTVSEAVADHADGDVPDRFRLGGDVVEGSVEETADGVTFEMTDGTETVAIEHHGDPPDLFRNTTEALVVGTFDDEGVFQSDELIVKHGPSYEPPSEGDDVRSEGVLR
jgi:cytochrome c-type biogenesis protein CcmE